MKIVQSITSHIHPSIRLTTDYPSKHRDMKVPMLDVKMWIAKIDDMLTLLHDHYEKPTATKSIVHRKSALQFKNKQTTNSNVWAVLADQV